MLRRRIWAIAGLGLGAIACASASAEPPKADAAKAGVAATVGGQPITTAELDARALKTNMKLAQSLYDARKQALDQLIMERLVEPEAKTKGVTAEKLLADKIAEKVKPVTDGDIESYYKGNSSRMGGKTLEQVSPQIRSFLVTQAETLAREGVLAQLKEKADVKITLDPPRMEVVLTATDPIKGAKDAKVTIVEFSEFQCPYCSRVGPTLKQIEEAYPGKVRIAFRHFALPMHNRAQPAGEAADCANEQGKFWEFHDKLFANQQALSNEDFTKYATEIGLDTEAFKKCFESGKFTAEVKKDAADGQALGVTGTPAFFVNGRFLSGAQPFEAFKAIIDEELAR